MYLSINKIFSFYSVLLCLLILTGNEAIGQNKSKNVVPTEEPTIVLKPGTPVVPFNDTIFFIYENLGTFTAQQRAHAIEERIERISESFDYNKDSLVLAQNYNGYINLLYQDEIIMSIDSAQALRENSSMLNLAKHYRETIITSIKKDRDENSMTRLFLQIVAVTGIFIGGFYLIKVLRIIFRRLIIYIKSQEGVRVKELFGFIEADKQISFYISLVKILRTIIILVIIYLALTLLFNLFHATRDISSTLLDYIISPIRSFGRSFITFLPDLIKMIVIIVLFRLFIKLLKTFTEKVADGSVRFKGFYPDWAFTTYYIIRGLLFMLLFILIYNLIPNSDDPVFQGVSVFAGIIFSLGSTTIVNNFISGFVITYMRSFKIGDRIKIGEVVGDVIEKTPLVIRIKTPKNEVITMPNSSVMSAQTINYTASAHDFGLILYLNVSVDLATPWKQVHDLLLKVAYRTENISKKQKPFILQDRIHDLSVDYQLNIYIKDASLMSKVYSDLRQNVQDVFDEAGISLFTPIYYSNTEERNSTKKNNSSSKNENVD